MDEGTRPVNPPPKRRVIFTKRERHRWTQNGIGHRPVNDWGSGDLPAPFAEGDIVRRISGASDDRLHGMAGEFFVVSYACSIDDGDAWYFRVTNGEDDGTFAGRRCFKGSDRLHVASAALSTYEECDWMSGFELVDTADPEGLALRERMLADGWTPSLPDVCSECGRRR